MYEEDYIYDLDVILKLQSACIHTHLQEYAIPVCMFSEVPLVKAPKLALRNAATNNGYNKQDVVVGLDGSSSHLCDGLHIHLGVLDILLLLL